MYEDAKNISLKSISTCKIVIKRYWVQQTKIPILPVSFQNVCCNFIEKGQYQISWCTSWRSSWMYQISEFYLWIREWMIFLKNYFKKNWIWILSNEDCNGHNKSRCFFYFQNSFWFFIILNLCFECMNGFEYWNNLK